MGPRVSESRHADATGLGPGSDELLFSRELRIGIGSLLFIKI